MTTASTVIGAKEEKCPGCGKVMPPRNLKRCKMCGKQECDDCGQLKIVFLGAEQGCDFACLKCRTKHKLASVDPNAPTTPIVM